MPLLAPIAPWRLTLQPASFNGVQFHVDMSNRSSGRRIAMHEYPNNDIPYAEDLGRRPRSFVVIGYIIGPDFQDGRDQLIDQLEVELNGQLVLPTSQDIQIVVCNRYSVTERREQGGYCQFEMMFSEAGQDPSLTQTVDTPSAVSSSASSATQSFGNSSDVTILT